MFDKIISSLSKRSRALWIIAWPLFWISVIYGTINHRGLFGETAKAIYSFLSYRSTTFSINEFTINPDVFIRWPAWIILKILPIDTSYSTALFILEVTYLIVGFLTFLTLIFIFSRGKQPQFPFSPTMIFAFLLQGTLIFAPNIMVAVVFYITAFYALLLRKDTDWVLTVLGLAICLLLSFSGYSLAPCYLLLTYITWVRQSQKSSLPNNVAFRVLTLLTAISFVKLFSHADALINLPTLSRTGAAQWEFFLSSLMFLVPAFYYFKKNEQSYFANTVDNTFLVLSSLLVFNALFSVLESTVGSYAVSVPTLIYLAFLLIWHKSQNIAKGSLIPIAIFFALGTVALNMPLNLISIIRENIFLAIGYARPNSGLQFFVSLALYGFIASQLIAEEKRTKSYYFIVFVSGLAGIIGAGFAFSVPWTQLDVIYNQQFFIKLAFLFSFILVLSTNSKFRAEIGFQNWMKILAPVMVVIWSMSGLLVTSQWKEGLDRLREIQARRPGCQLIEDLNEKRFLMERGINVSSSQYISLLLNGSWTITSIVFFADFQDPTNNLCEVKTWTSGVKYLGSESWANSSAPWLAMPLIERQFNFSHFFETPK